jgi:aminoglycoside phosphotransferase family enzyme
VAEPFITLFRAFLDAYLEKTRDGELWDVIPPFLAFRALVIGHPRWYPYLDPRTRAALLGFARALMAGGPLVPERMPEMLVSES